MENNPGIVNIVRPEDQHIEYKEIWKDEYLKVLAAFANSGGGKLVLGINDKREICGFSHVSKLMEDIPNKINNILGILADVKLNQKEGKKIIEIKIKPGSHAISYKGHYYIRSGSTIQELRGGNLQQFLLSGRNGSWDEQECKGVTLDDFDIISFVKKPVFLLRNLFSTGIILKL